MERVSDGGRVTSIARITRHPGWGALFRVSEGQFSVTRERILRSRQGRCGSWSTRADQGFSEASSIIDEADRAGCVFDAIALW